MKFFGAREFSLNSYFTNNFSANFIFSFLILSGFSFTAHAQSDFDCISVPEVKATMADFHLKMLPVLLTLPVPLSFTYTDMDFPLGGYAEFTKPHVIAIHVVGHDCRDKLTRDAFKLLLCHELGHSAGGAPFMTFLGSEQTASAEGEADFFATSACLPTLFAGEDNRGYLEEEKNFPELSSLCREGDDQARGLCMRIALASFSFAEFIHHPEEEGSSMPPKSPGPAPLLGGKSKVIAPRTLTREYPTTQCRLDTMLLGASCPALEPQSNYTANPQSVLSCAANVAAVPRPACWFKD